MYVPVMLEFEAAPNRYYRYMVTGSKTEFTIEGLQARPRWIRLNPFQSVLAKIND